MPKYDYAQAMPVDTLTVTGTPGAPPIFSQSEALKKFTTALTPATNAMIDYMVRHAPGIFITEMEIGLTEGTGKMLNAEENLSKAQSEMNDAKAALDKANLDGTPQQIAQAKIAYMNAENNYYLVRNDYRQIASELLQQQVLYNNGLIGFGVVPEGDTPNSLNSASAGYQAEIGQMTEATNVENNYINQNNANINTTQNDLNRINSGNAVAGYESVIETTMTQVAQDGEKIASHAGEKAGEIAKKMAANVNGKKINNQADALAKFEKIRNQPKANLSAADRNAISQALAALDMQTLATNLDNLGKAFGLLDKGFTAKNLYGAADTGLSTGNWQPLILELESMAISGIAAAYTYTYATSALIGLAAIVGVSLPATTAAIVAALIAGAVASALDSDFADELNNTLIPSLY